MTSLWFVWRQHSRRFHYSQSLSHWKLYAIQSSYVTIWLQTWNNMSLQPTSQCHLISQKIYLSKMHKFHEWSSIEWFLADLLATKGKCCIDDAPTFIQLAEHSVASVYTILLKGSIHKCQSMLILKKKWQFQV